MAPGSMKYLYRVETVVACSSFAILAWGLGAPACETEDPYALDSGEIEAVPQTAALITALILERPLCFSCIATKVGTSETGVEASLAIVAPIVQVHRDHQGRCRACGDLGPVVSLLRPESRGR